MSTHVLTGPEAAAVLGVRVETLRAWRILGTGPAFIRYGGPRGRVRYAPSALDSWMEGRTHQSTGEEAVSSQRRVPVQTLTSEGGTP